MVSKTIKYFWVIQTILIFSPVIYSNDYNSWPNVQRTAKEFTEWAGGIVTDQHRLKAEKSPYVILNNVIVEDTGELIIDPGVTLKFTPKTGITVKGSIKAYGDAYRKIVMTSSMDFEDIDENLHQSSINIRLVDGSSVLSGRLQLFVKGAWRSICTSTQWSKADLHTVCRHLGYRGGQFLHWMEPNIDKLHSRLMLSDLQCGGTENNLFECKGWLNKKLGSGSCDLKQDIALECLPYYENSFAMKNYWQGIKFEKAQSKKKLIHHNTLYQSESLSELNHVIITYAGVGADFKATSVLQVNGVPPLLKNVSILHSAYNGINITTSDAILDLQDCIIKNNQGYGIFMNSSFGQLNLFKTLISNNKGDGVHIVQGKIDQDLISNINELCSLPTTTDQTFPIIVSVQQNQFNPKQINCYKSFSTKYGQVLSVNIEQTISYESDNSSFIYIYDGEVSTSERLLATIPVHNNTVPLSITSSRNTILVQFSSPAKKSVFGILRVTSGFVKWHSVNISESILSDNIGSGLFVENLYSAVSMSNCSIQNNSGNSGVNIFNGSADVTLIGSQISYNNGFGILTNNYGGVRNITYSEIKSNSGPGIAVRLLNKHTKNVLQKTILTYSLITNNSVVIDGWCHGKSSINVTGNVFSYSIYALEIKSCTKRRVHITNLIVSYNEFYNNKKLAILIRPMLNIDSVMEYNRFKKQEHGCILIKNDHFDEDFDESYTNSIIKYNEFYDNSGSYVVNLGLSTYSQIHNMLFTWNYLKSNKIVQPFKIISRNKVAAVIVIGSSNIHVMRNIIDNPLSDYEIGVQLEDQSLVVNATYNWLGKTDDHFIVNRLFHRRDRYNLAKIEFVPFLLHPSNPGTTSIMTISTIVTQLYKANNDFGGEVDGVEYISSGEYIVTRDINVATSGKLVIHPDVTLKFNPGVGIMVAGKLEARGRGFGNIKFTLHENLNSVVNESIDTTINSNVRLIAGRTYTEGRLQVYSEELGSWGSVCNYGWSMENAALVCRQLGLVLNPLDWTVDVPIADPSEPIFLTNVTCSDEDIDLTKCKAEQVIEFDHGCNHSKDVAFRCEQPGWTGLRLGVLADTCNLQYITIEKAGLVDYVSNTFGPALQVDLNRHTFDGVKILDNSENGLEIIYSDLYYSSSYIHNSEFSGNKGAGICFKQFGLNIHDSNIERNKIGIQHDVSISIDKQRELAGWFKPFATNSFLYSPVLFPNDKNDLQIELKPNEFKYVITKQMSSYNLGESIQSKIVFQCTRINYVVGIQMLNIPHNNTSEQITVYNIHSNRANNNVLWSSYHGTSIFPTQSISNSIIMHYNSGFNPRGNIVLLVSCNQATINQGLLAQPEPTLYVTKTAIKSNEIGILATYYSEFISIENQMDVNKLKKIQYYLRPLNETINLYDCDISYNKKCGFLVQEKEQLMFPSLSNNKSHIHIIVNQSIIADNGKIIDHYSKDTQNSLNVYKWELAGNSFERNLYDGIQLILPYLYSYDENFTHSVVINNNSFVHNSNLRIDIGGHFSVLNITQNSIQNNICNGGLITISGMEKYLLIWKNTIISNNGEFMVKFSALSQCEIMSSVFALFRENILKSNLRLYTTKLNSALIVFDGIQNVKIDRNIFSSNNNLNYAIIAGLKTSRTSSVINLANNWWGSVDVNRIKELVFDFDDWNNNAITIFTPFLIDDSFDASLSMTWDDLSHISNGVLGGKISESLTVAPQEKPYVVESDITVMPGATLRILPGTILEFAPNVGILVLGSLIARGYIGGEITFKPLSRSVLPPQAYDLKPMTGVRLNPVKNVDDSNTNYFGFLEIWNSTLMQWLPSCDHSFTEANAKVVCKEIGSNSSTLNTWFTWKKHYYNESQMVVAAQSWPQRYRCSGYENNIQSCPILNITDEFLICDWNDESFVFVYCTESILPRNQQHWGGIRFANNDFEVNDYTEYLHDDENHGMKLNIQSQLQFVKIDGAGVLHNELSSAVMAIGKSPYIDSINITNSASHGVSILTFKHQNIHLFSNWIENNTGIGVNIISLTGEGQENDESSFNVLKYVNLPKDTFGLLDMCDPTKDIVVFERMIVHFKYGDQPLTCVKIFRSHFGFKSLGLRILQLNLAHNTDYVSIYDGIIYNKTSEITRLVKSSKTQKRRFFKSTYGSISLKAVAHAASSRIFGFIAEIVTLPIAAIGFDRNTEHNISYSVLNNNLMGSISYTCAGEVNPHISIAWNKIMNNCKHIPDTNISTCEMPLQFQLQNTQSIQMHNNLLIKNQGGLKISADSSGYATALQANIHNNLFTDNFNLPVLNITGNRVAPQQKITIFRNFFSNNTAPFENIIQLYQVVSNFTYNYVYNNIGLHILKMSGFQGIRLPLQSVTLHNGFYWNEATDILNKGTILALSNGQYYVHNVFYNPENNYEIIAATINNRSLNDFIYPIEGSIDARHNYWGFNDSVAVFGRIKDYKDEIELMAVDVMPYYSSNKTLLESEKCPPPWILMSSTNTCFAYIAVPMTFYEAKTFCTTMNASMPFITGDYSSIRRTLQLQIYDYGLIWVQHIDYISQCTALGFNRVQTNIDCFSRNAFLCEMDPQVVINPLKWRDDIVNIAVTGLILGCLFCVTSVLCCWWTKSKRRHSQRLTRRNSIRQSLTSLRSLSLSQPTFSDLNYRRKPLIDNPSGFNTISTKINGSTDSILKSQFNSSVDDYEASDLYEVHNGNDPINTENEYDLAYKNKGFRDNSTFASTVGMWTDLSSRGVYSSADVLETNLDLAPSPPPRSHSQPLETSM
ncbi:protein bark beetle [Daktulosphaira vitifoliae]|uniref:protein bark beetle n=1 Tax=Daktulosphaira vitifoliae TaxID=58002 RepID=UPI0021AA97B2|nr:protein bark beetle [Daktulosphaira vitifoliae]